MRILLLFLLIAGTSFTQEIYPEIQNPPLNIPMLLSGTFGELRTNHFHSGLDIRTQQKEGLPVYAADEGYIARIKISPFGYGKAIYINHPNGYTTVYGHLQKGFGKIEDFIIKEHYKQKKFEYDITLNPKDLPVKKGEQIAFSGNTGGSGGPHLHFEYRDTKTEKIINPMFFGMNKLITDTKPPVLSNIVVYPLDETSVANRSELPFDLNFTKQNDGSYIASKVLAKGCIGLGISAYDVSDNNYGRNGVYKIISSIDGKPNFEITFDAFSFDETRYVNAYVDFERQKKLNQKVQKLFYRIPYNLTLIDKVENSGIIEVANNISYTCKIEIYDFHQNKTILFIPIHYDAAVATVKNNKIKTNYFLKASIENIYYKNGVTVTIPENTFYDDFYLDFDVYGDVVKFHNQTVSPHKNYAIKFENQQFVEDPSKYFIASFDGKNFGYNKSYIKENTITTYTKNVGQFKVVFDKDSPVIKNVNVEKGKWISSQKTIQCTISDDLSGIATYNGYLNGNWILFEYDYKTKKLIHNLEDAIYINGKNDLKIEVVDNVGNSTIFETHFFKSKTN